MLAAALGLWNVKLCTAEVYFPTRILEVRQPAVGVYIDGDALKERAAALLAKHSLGVCVNIVAADAKKFPSPDSSQQHTVESKELESHLNDHVLHGHVARHELDVFNFALIVVSLSGSIGGLVWLL